MSNIKISESCYLCDADSTFLATDHENRRHYLCSNNSCGEYEISVTAMKRLLHNSDFKSQLLPLAKKCKGTSRLLEIIVNGSNIEAKIQPRR